MSSQKGIKLTLAIALLVSLVVVLGLTLNVGWTAAAKPIRAKLLRKNDEKRRKLSGPELALLRKQIPEKKERTFKARDFKDRPLSIRQVKNLQSDTWHKDLAIEVKNTSTKPIYSILAYLEFPDDPVSGNGVSGFTVAYGERKYIDLRRVGDPQDPHLNPGDTYVFTIPEKMKKGLKVQHEKSPNNFNRLELHFGVISFGDGTGFAAEEFRDYRAIKLNPVTNKNHHVSRKSLVKPRSPPQSGCGPCARYVMDTQIYQTCWNYQADRACDTDLATTENWAPCNITVGNFFDCDGDGVKECAHDKIVPSAACPGYSPTPTPTPTPSPTPDTSPTPTPAPSCDQAKKPNEFNCSCSPPIFPGGEPYWDCLCITGAGEYANKVLYPQNNGCDPTKSINNLQGCCVCIDQSPCLGGGTRNKRTCLCPTPTPDGGSGGGGPIYSREYDQEYYYPFYTGYDYCTPHVWVYYVSYDNGETWIETGETEYAGCW